MKEKSETINIIINFVKYINNNNNTLKKKKIKSYE